MVVVTIFSSVLDNEQPLFFRSPSRVKQKKKKSARKLGASARLVPNFRALLFFLLYARRTAKKIGAVRSLVQFKLTRFVEWSVVSVPTSFLLVSFTLFTTFTLFLHRFCFIIHSTVTSKIQKITLVMHWRNYYFKSFCEEVVWHACIYPT